MTVSHGLLEPGFEELYRVGSLHGDDWDTFGGVSAVAFDGAGNLHILDGQAEQITVVDLQGNLVRQFGRMGEGPGEFSGGGTWALTVCSDGRIAVYDAGRRTFVLFGPTGELERTTPLDGPTFISIPGVQADHGSPWLARLEAKTARSGNGSVVVVNLKSRATRRT